MADFIRNKHYFRTQDLKNALRERNIPFHEKTLRQYLYELKREEKLFSAGRGWYSNISEPFSLNTRSVRGIIGTLRNQFPLLSFACWSTAQLQSYFHHLQGKSLAFLYAERDALHPLFEFLKESNLNCYLNPTKRDLDTLSRTSEETFVLRPSISEEPRNGYFATIEKILVDLFIEHERLQLFDVSEYESLFKRIVSGYRIDMAKLIRYASRRGVKRAIKEIID